MHAKPRLPAAAPFALAAALALPVLPGVASADVSFNVGVVSDYRYRGISQSRLKPAIQGGVDYAHDSGFYVGAWGSTVKWIEDLRGSTKYELDLYGGWKGEVTKGVTVDVGMLRYVYPSPTSVFWLDAGLVHPNTQEFYGAVSYGPATLKYSRARTPLFGLPQSKGSQYLDLTLNFEFAGFTITPHIGRQAVKGPLDSDASYTDWSLAVGKDVGGVLLTATLVGTNADKDFYVPGPAANSTKFLGKTGLVLGAKYSF